MPQKLPQVNSGKNIIRNKLDINWTRRFAYADGFVSCSMPVFSEATTLYVSKVKGLVSKRPY